MPQAGGDSDVKNSQGVEAPSQCLVEGEESHSQPIPPTCDSTMRGECMCTIATRGTASCGIRATSKRQVSRMPCSERLGEIGSHHLRVQVAHHSRD